MEVQSENVKYSENYIDVIYEYNTTVVEKSDTGKLMVSFQFLFNCNVMALNLKTKKCNGRPSKKWRKYVIPWENLEFFPRSSLFKTYM